MQHPALSPQDLIVKANAAYLKGHKMARRSLPEFVSQVVKDENGQPVLPSHLQLAWLFHLTYAWNRGMHAMIWAPFGSGKTSAFAVPLSAWMLGNNPQLRIKFVCNSDSAAAARVEGAKTMIDSDEYKRIFPEVKRGAKWTGHEAYIRRAGAALDPSLHARGVDTKGIGGRADIIVFDDVVDLENSTEFLQRDKIKQRVHQMWMSRLDPAKGRALYICTPWHVDDLSHELLTLPNWCTLIQRVNPTLTGFDQEVYGASSQEEYLGAVDEMWRETDR